MTEVSQLKSLTTIVEVVIVLKNFSYLLIQLSILISLTFILLYGFHRIWR